MHIVRWIRMDSAVGCHAFGTRHGSLVRPVKLVTRCFCTLLWFCDFSGFQHWVQTNTVEVIWCPAVRHDVSMFCEKLCVCVCFQESTTRFALTWMVTLHATEFDDATEHDTYHRSTLIHIDAQLHRHFWLSGEEAPALPSGKSMFQVYASAVPALDETLRLPAIAEKSHWCQTLYAWIHTLYITMYVVSCRLILYHLTLPSLLLLATSRCHFHPVRSWRRVWSFLGGFFACNRMSWLKRENQNVGLLLRCVWSSTGLKPSLEIQRMWTSLRPNLHW